MFRWMLVLLSLPLIACAGDESIYAYGAKGKIWVLEEISGSPAPIHMTMEFLASGAVRGTLACNVFSGKQTAPYPWFEIAQLATTKRACPNIAVDARLDQLFLSMSQAEIFGDVLILRDETGITMLFQAENPVN